MHRLFAGLVCFLLIIPGAQAMEPSPTTTSQYYVTQSNAIIDALSTTFKGDRARDVVTTFRSCKKRLSSSSENQVLKKLRTYKSKILLGSEETTNRLRKLVECLCTLDDTSCAIRVTLHDNLCKILKGKIAHLDIDDSVVIDQALQDHVSVLPIALGKLNKVKRKDVDTLAECALAYTIASLAARTPSCIEIPDHDEVTNKVSAVIDHLYSEPVLVKPSTKYKSIAHHFSDFTKGIVREVPRAEFEPLKTITLYDLIGHRESREQLLKITDSMAHEYSAWHPLSKPFRLHESLRASLLAIKGLEIDAPDMLGANQESPVIAGLRSATQFTHDDVEHIARSVLSYVIMGYVVGYLD